MTMRERIRRLAGQDDGFSLMEVMVSMTILSFVMVVAIGGLSQVYTATATVDQTSVARDQLSNSFRRLDKEVRYASWISVPGQVGTRWYVEYALPTGCRQLTWNGGVLTLAAWDPDGTPSTPGTPTTLGTNLTLTGGKQPFTLSPAGAKPYASVAAGTAGVGNTFENEHAMLRLQFSSTVGKIVLPFDTTFSALNNDRNSSPLNDCSKGRPTS